MKNITADDYCVDSLHHASKNCHSKWKYPSQGNSHTAKNDQIVNWVVQKEWNITTGIKNIFYSQKY